MTATPLGRQADPTGRPSRLSRVRQATDGDGAFYLLIVPPFLILFLLTAVPLVSLIWTSMQEWNRASPVPPDFIGLSNFTALMGDAAFWKAAGLTAYQVSGTVILQIIFGLGIALLFSRQFRGVGLARALYLVPMMCAPVVVGLMWRVLLQTDNGPVNRMLAVIGIGPIDFLGDPALAMPSVIGTDLWLSTPFVVIILLAALQAIPQEISEAARVDGVSPWQMLRWIILPIIKPMIILATLFRTMDAIKRFDTIYVMTGGGPGNSTETLDLHAFAYAFTYLDVGKGAAIAVVMLALIIAISSLLLRAIDPTTGSAK
ncbi:sugar ABC transporter permease [Knoellia sp. S7-12]|uniref:carbohydrate ABC transporter permease n=1 Tax=Knoellia sp. S7-12 TaxID=3126698 RepID=UPI0033690B0D